MKPSERHRFTAAIAMPRKLFNLGCLRSSSPGHGFVRTYDGSITTFDAPGQDTGSGQGIRISQ